MISTDEYGVVIKPMYLCMYLCMYVCLGRVGAEGIYDMSWVFLCVLRSCLFLLHWLSNNSTAFGGRSRTRGAGRGATWTPLGHLGGALGKGNTTNDKSTMCQGDGAFGNVDIAMVLEFVLKNA